MCGIIAVLLADEDLPACQLLYDGITMLQHRGQDAAGIVTCDTRARTLHMRKSNGLVKEVFQTEHMLRLEGCMGISHCRYPTAGSIAVSAGQRAPLSAQGGGDGGSACHLCGATLNLINAVSRFLFNSS